ncbi:hypothetical protein Zmor_024397 [Zophobas morio]|uniref:Uncharacterized protein n=1 Tax=Zophobas morio TaxID=2755281 RepID=A0AA38I317_9CUCU|nr:hypothetical protein Zmor_024397 [Zophobas morio]
MNLLIFLPRWFLNLTTLTIEYSLTLMMYVLNANSLVILLKTALGAIAENGVAAVNTSKTNTEASLNNKRQTTDYAFGEDNPFDFLLKFPDNNDSFSAERLKKIELLILPKV